MAETFRMTLTVTVHDEAAEEIRQRGYGGLPDSEVTPQWFADYATGAADALIPGVTVDSAEVV